MPTDNEIIKALECYRGQKLFAFNGKKPEIYIHDIIDLINRQKAEIERLNSPYEMQVEASKKLENSIKAEAVKEFAERLKEELEGEYIKATNKLENAQNIVVSTNIKIVDNLVKEMVGENNAPCN